MIAWGFKQSFVILTFDMLLVNGKTFFRSQKHLKLINKWHMENLNA